MAVVYEDGIIMARTRLLNSTTSRAAYVTYACLDTTGSPTTQFYADGIQDAFADTLSAQIGSQVTIGPTDILRQTSAGPPQIATSTIANVVGTNGNLCPPANVAMIVKKTTGLSGRGNRGRLYLPWFGNESIVNEAGIIDAGSVTGAQTRFSAWRARLVTDTTPLVIANRVYDLPWDNPARKLVAVNIGPTVTAVVVEALCATQRRRMR